MISRRNLTRSLVLACVLTLAVRGTALAQDAQAEFQRGYFLQTHEGDLAGAVAAFEKVLAQEGAPEALRVEATLRLAQCREDLASQDFARLMPADAIAYVEINDPGEHIDRIARLMGLVSDGSSAPGAKPMRVPLGEGFSLPEDFTISPALLAELKKFRGLAAAVTSVGPSGMPDGVVVLHPGDSDLVRGFVETSSQILQPADPIGEFKTYRVAEQGWLTLTNRLIVASPSREQVVAVIARLRGAGADSLAESADLKPLQADREGALLFAYVSGPRATPLLAPHLRGEEAAIAKSVLDLEHLKALTATLRTTASGLQAQVKLDLMDGHRNLAYGMLRTAPLSRRSLDHVPSGAAAVALLGLNPPSVAAAPRDAGREEPQYVTAMDIGREIFSNIEELALFVLPGAETRESAGPLVPEMGLVLAVKDAKKSEALWSQLLSLAAAMGAPAATSREVTIEGRAGREYRFPEAPPITLVQLEDRAMVAGTTGAVAAAIRSRVGDRTIQQDPVFKPLLDCLTPQSSKAILIHAGRVLPLVSLATPPGGRQDEELIMAASVCRALAFSLVTDEGPTRLVVRGEVTGLPKVSSIIKVFAAREDWQPAKTADAPLPAAQP